MYQLILLLAVLLFQGMAEIAQETAPEPLTQTKTRPVIRQFPISRNGAKELEATLRDTETTRYLIDVMGATLTMECKSEWVADRVEKRLREQGAIAADAVGVEITKVERSLKIPAEKAGEVDKAILPFIEPKKLTYRYDRENQVATIVGWSKEVERFQNLLKEKGIIATSEEATVTKFIPLAKERMEELQNLVTQLGSKGVRLGYDENAKSAVVVGTQEKVEQIEKALAAKTIGQEEPPKSTDSKTFSRTISMVSDETDAVLEAISALKVNGKASFTENTGKVFLHLRAASEEDLNTIEDTLAKLGLATPAISVKVFSLKHANAEIVANGLAFRLEGHAKVVADARLNRLVVSGNRQELKQAETLIASLDIEENRPKSPYIEGERKPSSPDMPETTRKIEEKDSQFGPLGAEFAKAEAKSIATAGELRAALSEYGESHPKIVELKTRLETEVKAAFALRHRLQQAEAAELRRQLAEIESRLSKREKNQEEIVRRRVESLLKMDELGWEAMVNGKKVHEIQEEPPELAESSSENAVRWPKTAAVKERSEAFQFVEQKEFVSARSARSTRDSTVSCEGILIRGYAFVPRASLSDQIVSVGDKHLPSRLAGAAPMSIAVYRSDRFPSPGITELKREAQEGETAWAFIPGDRKSLTKAKVFLAPGADLAFDQEICFGIEADGPLDHGYVVCTSDGEFLGLVGRNSGSLGICLSAPAIAAWMERTNLERPALKDPTDAIVEVWGVNSVGQFTVSFCPIVKGVIVTDPTAIDDELKSVSVQRRGSKEKLTIVHRATSAGGEFGLIWCKEIKETEGFCSADAKIDEKDLYVFFDPERFDEARARGQISSFSMLRQNQMIAIAKQDETIFSLQAPVLLSQLNQQGRGGTYLANLKLRKVVASLTTVGGHWVGTGVGSSPEYGQSTQSRLPYEFRFRTAQEILRIVEEETKKYKAGGPAVAETSMPAPTSGAPPAVEVNAAKQKAAEDFWSRIKDNPALHRVFGRPLKPQKEGDSSPVALQFGAIVQGCVLFPQSLHKDALAEIDSQSLPVRLATIAPQGMYVYHRKRLPQGFTDLSRAVKEGEKIWTVAGPLQQNLAPGKAFTKASPVDGLEVDGETGFIVESEGRLFPGAMVFADDGAFLGLVAQNKGSVGGCISAPALKKWLDGTDFAAVEKQEFFPTNVDIGFVRPGQAGEIAYNCGTIVRGVIVANPEKIKLEPSARLKVEYNKKALSVVRVATSPDGKLALIWTKELTEKDGVQSVMSELRPGEFVIGSMRFGIGLFRQLPDDRNIRPVFFHDYEAFAARAADVSETEFEVAWDHSSSEDSQAILNLAGRWVGIELPKPNNVAEGAKEIRRVLKAKEVLRIVDEETKKLKESGGAPAATESDSTAKSPIPTTEATSSSPNEAKRLFRDRIKEPEAVIPVQVREQDKVTNGFKQTIHRQVGAMVQGCTILPQFLVTDIYAEVGEKSLPQELVTLTPGGLYVHYRERMPMGFISHGAPPKDGERVWTIVAGDRGSATSGVVDASDASALDMKLNKQCEFCFESDGRIEPGAVVFSDAGEFVGIVNRNKGSFGVCELATSITGAIERANIGAPLSMNRNALGRYMVAITNTESKKVWQCLIIRGVLLAQPELLDEDPTKLAIQEKEKQTPVILRASKKICNDRLALLWLQSPELPSQGLVEPSGKLIAGDYCCVDYPNSTVVMHFIKEAKVAKWLPDNLACQITKCDDAEFTLDWLTHGARPGFAVFTVGGRWAGVNLTKDEQDSAKVAHTKLQIEVIRAAEILRIIDEETKKLPPESAEKPAAAPAP